MRVAYEVKWDGFRAIVSTEGPPRVRSRRGWNMTERVGFLEQLPVQGVFDCGLVAFGEDGKADFERVCERMLIRHDAVTLVFIAFDVLSVEGEDMRPPYLSGERVWVQVKNRAYWRYELERKGHFGAASRTYEHEERARTRRTRATGATRRLVLSPNTRRSKGKSSFE